MLHMLETVGMVEEETCLQNCVQEGMRLGLLACWEGGSEVSAYICLVLRLLPE